MFLLIIVSGQKNGNRPAGNRSYLCKVVAVFIKEIVSDVCGAYLKTQITIMIIVSALCSIAFGIVHNPYFILLGILIGLADILPLIGAGTFLVPITVYYFIYGRTKEGLIFFITISTN